MPCACLRSLIPDKFLAEYLFSGFKISLIRAIWLDWMVLSSIPAIPIHGFTCKNKELLS